MSAKIPRAQSPDPQIPLPIIPEVAKSATPKRMAEESSWLSTHQVSCANAIAHSFPPAAGESCVATLQTASTQISARAEPITL
jgi:hypothetical protein